MLGIYVVFRPCLKGKNPRPFFHLQIGSESQRSRNFRKIFKFREIGLCLPSFLPNYNMKSIVFDCVVKVNTCDKEGNRHLVTVKISIVTVNPKNSDGKATVASPYGEFEMYRNKYKFPT